MTDRELPPVHGTPRSRRFWLAGVLAMVASCTAGGKTPTEVPPPPPPAGAVASVLLSPGNESIVVGSGKQFSATVRDASNNVLIGRTVTWTSSQSSLATVSSTGQVVGLYQGGPVTIRATVEGVTGTATVTVMPPQKPSIVEMRSVMDSARAAFARSAAETQGDALRALVTAANRMEADPRVKRVVLIDSTAMQIELKTGMLTMVGYNQVGADGRSITRGGSRTDGSSGGSLTHFRRAANVITNRKVLFCAARATEFYEPGELERVIDLARNAGLGLDVTVLKDDQCSWQAVQTFPNYGLVFIDTHGFPNGFMVGSKSITVESGGMTDADFKTAMDAAWGPGTYDGLLAGDFGTTFTWEVGPTGSKWWENNLTSDHAVQLWVTSQFIRKLSLPNTIVYGNMCYSGAITDLAALPTGYIQPAFMSTGVPSYYGYAFLEGDSHAVRNDKAKEFQELFVRAMVVDGDSTGIAHLDSQSREMITETITTFKVVGTRAVLGPPRDLHLRQAGHLDYSYVKVVIDPETVEGEFGKRIDFRADDKGSGPTDAIYEWDFGDGTPVVRVTGSKQVQHTFQLPAGTGSCQSVTFEVKLNLLNNATGSPVKVATAKGTARLKNPCSNWILTSLTDVDDFFGDDIEGEIPMTIALQRLLTVPGAGVISVTSLTASTSELQLRVLKTSTWDPTHCCQAPSPPSEETDVPFGRMPAVPHSVGPFFAGWNSSFWSQSTADVSTGTMTGQDLLGTRAYVIKNAGTQTGPTGGTRFTASRSGMTMTGTISLWIWWLNDDNQIDEPPEEFRFAFTATRPASSATTASFSDPDPPE